MLTGLLGAITLIAVLGYLYRHEELKNLVIFAEDKNVELVQTLSNVFLEFYLDQIEDLQDKPRSAFIR